MTITAGLALLSLTGTAVAARTGNLPQGAQQHAHRLFSALGVPAPRTGPPRPVPSTTPTITALAWCDAWPGGAHGSASPPRSRLSGEDRRRLVAAAGGEEAVDRYCAELRRSASASPSARTAPPSGPARPPSAGPPATARTPAPAGPGTATPAGTPPTATTPTDTPPTDASPTVTGPPSNPTPADQPNAAPETVPPTPAPPPR
ncbi:hypothetical protein ACQPZX_10295 [Actinoplanes sp. CA-142083]|uniref:hypothetical protein n=1 Tax=Actinoplanes sp. CA-142083 TaxID=3239903 RepID=UPI003D93D748